MNPYERWMRRELWDPRGPVGAVQDHCVPGRAPTVCQAQHHLH